VYEVLGDMAIRLADYSMMFIRWLTTTKTPTLALHWYFYVL